MFERSFYFLRHGETDWNARGILQGFSDIPLNDTGRAQAQLAAPILQRQSIDHIVVSDLSRAKETADIVNNVLNKPIVIDENLRERNFGQMEGLDEPARIKLRQDMEASGLKPEENGYPCSPGGETYIEFKMRVVGAINQHLQVLNNHQNVLFVAHGGIYRVLVREMFQKVDAVNNAIPLHFIKQENDWHLSFLG